MSAENINFCMYNMCIGGYFLFKNGNPLNFPPGLRPLRFPISSPGYREIECVRAVWHSFLLMHAEETSVQLQDSNDPGWILCYPV